MDRRVLVIYGTSYGQTEKIAVRIAAGLQRRGFSIEVVNAATNRPSLPLEQYAGIVVGSSIIARGHQPAIKDFVRDHLATLNKVPSAFFQVSASAGSGSAHARMAAQQILDEFVAHNNWTPILSASMAGAINYTRYNLLLKWYMKKASAKNGGSTDTSRDHEYTDWAEVERFTMALAAAFHRVPEEVPLAAAHADATA